MKTPTTASLMIPVFICSLSVSSLADLSSDIEKAAGNRAKIVFAKCLAGEGDRDLQSPNYSLNGFDTYRGTFFEIVSGPRCCANPIITPDGNAVVFSDLAQNKVYISSWCGLPARELVSGYGLCVQKDPAGKIDWVYVSDSAYGTCIYRYDLADANRRELVWNRTKVSIRFSVSADGRFGGGEFPWSTVGEVTLPNRELQKFGSGCNAGIAPDNSYRLFHMDGDHRSVWMYDSGGKNVREIRLDHAPGVDSNPAWIPRWSSDARFLTMTAPCRSSAPIHREDIYFGCFNEAHDSVINWIRITNTADTFENYAYAWIGRERYVRLDKYDIDFVRNAAGIDPRSRNVTVSSPSGPLGTCTASFRSDWLRVRTFGRNGKVIAENTIDTARAAAPGLYSTIVTLACAGYADECYRVNLKVEGVSAPTSLTIAPKEARLRQFDSLSFRSSCFDRFKNPLAHACGWSSTGGGSLNDAGVFKSNGDTGVFVIRAWVLSASMIKDSTTIRVFENPRILLPVETTIGRPGDSLIIRWCSHEPEFKNLMVYLSLNSGRSWQLLNPVKAIYPDFDTAGRFSWLIPNSICDPNAKPAGRNSSNSCLVKITDYLDEIETVSDAPFSIVCGDPQSARKSGVGARKKTSQYAFLRAVPPEEIISVTVFSPGGRLVGGVRDYAGRIRICPLPKGIYIVKIAAAPRTWNEKFMVW